MNSKTFPFTTQSLVSSHESHTLLKFNINHVKISTQQRNITTKAHGPSTPAPENETFYDLLGISKNVTLFEIKQAYKKMALKYHPDVSPPDMLEEYTARFIQVQKAYETLSDPKARSMYDNCVAKDFVCSGKRETQFDPKSGDKKRSKETWEGQILKLQRRSRRVDKERGMSWAAQIRMQRNKECVNESDPAQ